MSNKAFISYSHATDSVLAPAIQSALQRIAKPWYLARSFRVFRDTTNLSAAPELWRTIEKALEESEYLLFLASPKAAVSKWVRKELTYWKENKSSDKLLIILTDGQIVWDDQAGDFDWAETTALPDMLRGYFRSVPLYANLAAFRGTKLTLDDAEFGHEIAMIAATLHGCNKDEIFGEELRQHHKTMRLYRAGVALLMALLVVAASLGRAAWVQRGIAQQNESIANENEQVAKQNEKRAMDNERKAREVSFEAMTNSGLGALSNGRELEALHWFAQAIREHEEKVPTHGELERKREFEAMVPPSLLWGGPEKKNRGARDAHSPSRLRLGAAAPAYGLHGITHDWEDPLFYNADKTGSLTKSRVIPWNLESSSRIDTLTQRTLAEPDRSSEWLWLAVNSHAGVLRIDRNNRNNARIEKLDGKTLKITVKCHLQGHRGQINSAAFNADGTRVVTASDDGTAIVWDGARGRPIVTLAGHKGMVFRARFNGDGSRVVTASADKTARIWNPEAGSSIELVGHQDAVGSAEFSPDGHAVVTASSDRTARVWDAKTGSPRHTLKEHQANVLYAEFSPDSKSILTLGLDAVTYVWDAATGLQIAELIGQGQMFSAEFGHQGQSIVTRSWTGEEREWMRTPFGPPIPIAFPATEVGAAGVSEFYIDASAATDDEGKYVVTAFDDQPVRVWDMTAPSHNPKLIGTLEATKKRRLRGTATISRTGAFIASLNAESITIFDRKTLQPIKQVQAAWSGGDRVEMSPDGDRIVYPTENKARLIQLSNNGAFDLVGHTNRVRYAAFSRDARWVVTASADQSAMVFAVPYVAGAPPVSPRPKVFRGHNDELTWAAFDNDGRQIVTASRDRTARIWDVESQKLRQVLHGHNGGVNSVALSPDGHLVVTASNDRTARVWDAADGKQICILPHQDGVVTATFHPVTEGYEVLTVSMDGRVQLWALRAMDGDPSNLPAWAKILTGTVLENGVIRGLDGDEWERLCKETGLPESNNMPDSPRLRPSPQQ